MSKLQSALYGVRCAVHPVERSLRILRGRARMAVWDRVCRLPDTGFTIEKLHEASAQPFLNLPRDFDDNEINRVFSWYRERVSPSNAVRVCGDVVVEPRYGYVVAGRHTLISESLPYSESSRVKESQQYFVGYPQLSSLFTAPKRVVHVKRAISLRIAFETNYWHAYNDVLAKLVLLDDLQIPRDIPVIVGRELAESRFFNDIVRRIPGLEGRILFQEDKYIRADEIIYCRALSHQRRHLDRLLDDLGCPVPTAKTGRHLLLTRAKNRPRRIANIDEVARVCAQAGFEVIETEAMSVDEQIQTFSGASFVIGIHGAGLTNLMFRRGAPMQVIEIMPTTRFSATYAWMCGAYGYGYDAIQGTADPDELRDLVFHVDPQRLKLKIQAMLEAPDHVLKGDG